MCVCVYSNIGIHKVCKCKNVSEQSSKLETKEGYKGIRYYNYSYCGIASQVSINWHGAPLVISASGSLDLEDLHGVRKLNRFQKEPAKVDSLRHPKKVGKK